MKQAPRDQNFHERCNTAMLYTDFRHRHGDVSLDCRLARGGDMRWHMVTCFREAAAAAGLMARGFGVYLPSETMVAVRRGRKLIAHAPMFAGLLFVCVRAIELQRERILSVPGVTDIVRSAERAVVVPDAAIDKIKVIEMEQLVRAGLIDFDPDGAAAAPPAAKQKSRRARKRARARERERERAAAAPPTGELRIRIMCLGDPDAEEIAAAVAQAAIAKAPPAHRRDLLYRAMGLRPPGESNTAAAASGSITPHGAGLPVAAGAGGGAERPPMAAAASK